MPIRDSNLVQNLGGNLINNIVLRVRFYNGVINILNKRNEILPLKAICGTNDGLIMCQSLGFVFDHVPNLLDLGMESLGRSCFCSLK